MKIKNILKLWLYFLVATVILRCHNSDNKSISCAEAHENYRQFLEMAKQDKKRENELNRLKETIDENPACFYANMLVGDIYATLGAYEVAKPYYLKANKTSPNNVHLLFNIGVIYNFENKYDSAILFFRSAADLKTSGGFYSNEEKGLGNITNEPNFDVKYDEIIFNNGIASYYDNHLLDAMDEFNYCIEKNKYPQDSYFFRALLFIKNKDYKKACNDFELAKKYGNPGADSCLKIFCTN